MEKVTRPAASTKKINCKEEFELCYLRHQYLRKAEYNPTDAEMSPYYKIASQQARNTYFTYQSLLASVGLECDDVINIAKIHIVSYLGLFSVEKLSDRYDQFVCKHIQKYGDTPNAEASLNKNKANFTIFLKQRMEDLVRVCRQKIRNIRGFPGDEHYIYVGEKNPPKVLSDLMDNHEKYGYRKLDIAVFKTVRKRAKAYGLTTFEFEGKFYISLKYDHKKLDISDFSGADMDPYDTIHYMSPDRIFAEREETVFWANKRVEFDTFDSSKRVKLLKTFVSKHKNKAKFKEEVKIARKMIKEIGE
jgi:hypothetical protein